jgi:membrane fusion protein (multidrug efflux system)
MDAKVDITKTGGRMLADASQSPTHATTAVFDDGRSAAEADVQRIIAANSGRAAQAPVAQRQATPPQTAVRTDRAASLAQGPASTAAH